MVDSEFHLSERAVERIAEAAIRSVPGSISLDAKLAGLAGRGLPRVSALMDRRAGTVSFEADVAAAYPSPIAAVTDCIRAAVISQVRTLTGLEVTRVDVKVADAKAFASRVDAADLERYRERGMDLIARPVSVTGASSRVRSVTTPQPRPLRPVIAPEAPQVRTRFVVAPQPPLTPIQVSRTPRVAVEIVRTRPVTHPLAPAPLPLRPIHITPVVEPHGISR
ncbi:Asp23/Gls24 family envelope stress response protein [Corynebacterium liangguodongii]|uniref:Asp23/Gls24 family envelope stress response protein n=1 Tax=Corynebacterium liangguodongii TaxID=2079535 RepID=UPI001304DB77|nr:Asp23/Gls24 family envelope stress response protein [Corynebacterium liangguodongii]